MDMPNKNEIGQRIRQLRLTHNYTQAEFAEKIDLSINFLSEIENGKKGLSQDTLVKICQELNTSCDYLLFGEHADKISFIELANSLSLEELRAARQYLEALIAMREIL